MNAAINRQVTLAARPAGMPKASDFSLAEEPVPEPRPGQALVRVLSLSLDPYMRGRMSDAKSYAAPVGIGDVMTGGAVGEVVRSEASGLKEGDLVEGMFGWQEYALCSRGSARVLPRDLAEQALADGIDCAVITTEHRGVDYRAIARDAPLVVDTRNALAGIDAAHIYRL